MPAEGAVDRAHQLHIEREDGIPPRDRAYILGRDIRGALMVFFTPTARVDDAPPIARLAAQDRLEALLNARAANPLARPKTLIFIALKILGADLIEVADRVGAERTIRIMAHRAGDDVDAREIVMMRLERGHLIAAHIGEHLDLMRPPIGGHRLEPGDERLTLRLGELHQRA